MLLGAAAELGAPPGAGVCRLCSPRERGAEASARREGGVDGPPQLPRRGRRSEEGGAGEPPPPAKEGAKGPMQPDEEREGQFCTLTASFNDL